MRRLRERSGLVWAGGGLLLTAALILAGGLALGAAPRALACAALVAALGLRFGSYGLEDPGFSVRRAALVAAVLASLLTLGLLLPARSVVPVFSLGAVLVGLGTAGDVWGLWRRRRLAG